MIEITIKSKVSMVSPLRYPFTSSHDASTYLTQSRTNNTIQVYTDGACAANFESSGGGIVYGLCHKLNASIAFSAPHCNKRAEILAITFALWQLLQLGQADCHVVVKTDFLSGILFFDRKASADGIGCREELNQLNALAQCFIGDVEIDFVKGHETDQLNCQADRLAKLATQPERKRIHNSKPWRVDMKNAFDLLLLSVHEVHFAEKAPSNAHLSEVEDELPEPAECVAESAQIYPPLAAQSDTGSVAVDAHNNALCIGIWLLNWTVSDALAAAIVLLTEKYRNHSISSLDDPNCEVGFGYDGPFTYFEGDFEFNNKQMEADGAQTPTASTTRIVYSYHGKEAIARILSLNGGNPELTNDVWMAVGNEFIKPFDNAIVSGEGRLTDQTLPRDGSFIGCMEPFLEANPADSEQASLERFVQACYAADEFITRLVCAVAHRNMSAPQKALPEDVEVKVPVEASLPEWMPVGAPLEDDNATAPTSPLTPPPADPNPPAEAGENRALNSHVGTFESVANNRKNRRCWTCCMM